MKPIDRAGVEMAFGNHVRRGELGGLSDSRNTYAEEYARLADVALELVTDVPEDLAVILSCCARATSGKLEHDADHPAASLVELVKADENLCHTLTACLAWMQTQDDMRPYVWNPNEEKENDR